MTHTRPAPLSPLPRRPPEPAPGPPLPLRCSVALWITAVAAGVFETAVAVVRALGQGHNGGAVTGGAGPRMAAYAGTVLLTVALRRGRGAARPALAALCGGLVALAAAVGPVRLLTGGGHRRLAGLGALDALLGADRLLCLAAAFTAAALMFAPAVNAHFRTVRR